MCTVAFLNCYVVRTEVASTGWHIGCSCIGAAREEFEALCDGFYGWYPPHQRYGKKLLVVCFVPSIKGLVTGLLILESRLFEASASSHEGT